MSSDTRLDFTETTIIQSPTARNSCEVMIVDDDELLCEHMTVLLELAGYDVRQCRSGQEAIKSLAERPCSIVISDWEMPDMDGIALTRHLREQSKDSYIYILLLTIREGKRNIVAGLQAGADDYIAKGASPEEIVARVETGRRISNLEQSLRKANRENRRQATTDALTGVHNRAFLMKYLQREVERCQRHGHALSLLACDLDHFKNVNDRYGHEAGDDVLKEFCVRAQAALRSYDWLARSGGEEFIVVLPETAISAAQVVAERIRRAICAQPMTTLAGTVDITVSIGISGVALPTELLRLSHKDLLRAADRCLYQSKHAGRNRVTLELGAAA